MNKIDVSGWTINDLIEFYDDDRIIVDQRYQRKLVWSLDDKKFFIDSINKDFPIPTIIVAPYIINGVEKYGIIDGLQRINAVISFLLNEFDVEINGKTGFFNLASSRATFSRMQNDEIRQQEQVLEKRVCDDFLKKKLPIVITEKELNQEAIDEIFRRVNSTGTKLSVHDLRQAGATNDFSQLVRKIASAVRNSKTVDDKISLSKIKEISLSNDGLSYGVDINKLFWKKNGILTDSLIRQSRDEEIIAILLGSFLLQISHIAITPSFLNSLYSDYTEYGSKAKEEIENAKNNIYTLFVIIFNEIERMTIESRKTLDQILFDSKTRNKVDIFIILYQTLLDYFFESKEIGDYCDLANILEENHNIFNSLLEAKSQSALIKVVSQTRSQLKNILMPHMVDMTIGSNKLTNEVINRLSYSKLETKYTEYKIGLTSFKNGKLSKDNAKQIARVACSMANTISIVDDNYGMIVIGVADKEKDYQKWLEVYKKNTFNVFSHRVVGVDNEAEIHYNSVENLIDTFRTYVNHLPISSEMKKVLRHIEAITIYGRTVLVIQVCDISKQEYNGIKYARDNSSLVEIKTWDEIEKYR